MDENKEKLAGCFRTVFPDLPAEKVYTASQTEMPEWDSVAAISLVNVIEEEFGVELDFESMAELTTFPLILDYLKVKAA